MSLNRLIPITVLAAVIVGSLTPSSGAPSPTDTPTVPRSAPAPQPTSRPPGYELAWGDEFNGSKLDTGEWMYRTDSRIIGANRPENVSVSGGYLRIALRHEQFGQMPYTCGGVISKRWLGYGYYETRAKLWSDSGIHSSFWQMGLNPGLVKDDREPANQINEIDGFEIDSQNPTRVASNTHYYGPPFGGGSVYSPGGPAYDGADSGAGYHVYGWEWTPTQVTFYVDGRATGTVPYPGPHALQNVWLTSLAFTPPVDNANLPGEVTFDYFRYYQKRDTPRPVADAIVVDNADPAYSESGAWSSQADAFGFNDKDTRQTDQLGATATWTANRLHGNYEVYAWNPSFYTSSDHAATYTVTHARGTSTTTVSQLAAGQQWVPLGAYEFSGTAPATVTVEKTAADSGTLRTDAVMFVPSTVVDDGAAGYSETGQWSTIDGYAGGSARRSDDAGAHATWTIAGSTPGHHASYAAPYADRYADLYAWIPPADGATHHATYHVRGYCPDRDRSCLDTSVTVDQAAYPGAWADLGTYRLPGNATVEVTVEAGQGTLLADAVRLVRNAPVDQRAPDPPTDLHGVTSVVGADVAVNLSLSWAASHARDVVGYQVYLDGVRVTWQPLRKPSLSIPSMRFGHTYDVAVRAVDSSGNESQALHRAIAMPRDTTPPSSPNQLQVDPVNNGAMLSWSGRGVAYNVYLDGVRVNDAPVDTANYAIGGLASGQNYQFAVTAVDYSGNESARSAPVAATVAPVFAVSTRDPGYGATGDWIVSGLPGWAGTPSVASSDPGATARWTVNVGESGEYEAFAWIPNHANSTQSARYTINHDGASTSVLHTQQTGGNAWVSLGRYSFTGGAGASIIVSNATSAGWLRASAIKLVRMK